MKLTGCLSFGTVLIFAATFTTHANAPADGGMAALGGSFSQQLQFGTRQTLTVSWGDYDNDGDLDLAVGNNSGGNQLFTNNGNGTFTGQDQFGTGGGFSPATFALAWGDYDNDGDLDMAVGRAGQNLLCTNNGDGTFNCQNQFGSPVSTITMAWADFDRDGDLDLAVGNGILANNQQNYLYVNNGDGTFTQRAEFGGNKTQTMAWADFDKDGDPDLAVGNGGFGTNQPNFLYVNNDDGTFTSRPEFGAGGAANADTTSLQWGDFDNDGDLDMALGNWNNTQCKLYVNNGNGTFTGHSEFGARDTNAIAWGDYNNDGLIDLAVANGDFTSAEQNYLYANNGNGTFTEIAEFGLGSTDGVAWGDYDNDGDLDVAVGQEHSPPDNELYINNVNDNQSLRLHLVGHFHDRGPGYSNRDGIGAKITVYAAGGLGNPDELLAYREIEAHSGFSPQNAIDAFFGLANRTKVDVRIMWPGSGGSNLTQDFRGVAVGQRLVIHEGPTVPAVSTWGIVVMILALLSITAALQLRRNVRLQEPLGV